MVSYTPLKAFFCDVYYAPKKAEIPTGTKFSGDVKKHINLWHHIDVIYLKVVSLFYPSTAPVVCVGMTVTLK